MNIEIEIEINKIYPSIMGETNYWGQGIPVTIIRFQGCSLKCRYCDTKEARKKGGGTLLKIKQILKEVKKYKINRVLITGGEPLEQSDELQLLITMLHFEGYGICIETNGMHSIGDMDTLFVDCLVVDWKSHIDGYQNDMLVSEIQYLGENDFVKFLIYDHSDFVNAKKFVVANDHLDVNFAFSAISYNKSINSAILTEWLIKEPSLQHCLLNVQIHKLIGLKEK